MPFKTACSSTPDRAMSVVSAKQQVTLPGGFDANGAHGCALRDFVILTRGPLYTRPIASALGDSGHVGAGAATYPAWARRPWNSAVSDAQKTNFTQSRPRTYA